MEFFVFREPVSAWSHGLWFLLSLPATFLLWKSCRGDFGKKMSLLVFGLSLAFCYAGSTLYHAVRLSAARLDRFDRLDHMGIYILIAGSYTPMAWNLLSGLRRWGILAMAWIGCAAGSGLALLHGLLSTGASTIIYMLMGWGAVLCCAEVARVASRKALAPLVIGGILYSVGALINVVGWPVLWPGVVGPHEIFHLFVMAGSFAHFWFMLRFVALAVTPQPEPVRWPVPRLEFPRLLFLRIPSRPGS